MHALVRKSSFSKAQGLRETGPWLQTPTHTPTGLCKNMFGDIRLVNDFINQTSSIKVRDLPSLANFTNLLTVTHLCLYYLDRCLLNFVILCLLLYYVVAYII